MSDVEQVKPNLLILDDEQEILNSLKRLFRRDYDVFAFSHGDDALVEMKQRTFSVVISDMRMPNMDGATFLAQAREIQPNAIRLLLTGYSDMESTVKAVNDGGIYSYISKPWNNDELKLQVANALEQFNLERKNTQLTQKLAKMNLALKEHNKQLEAKVSQRTQALKSANEKLTRSAQKYRNIFLHVLEMVNLIVEKNQGQQKGHYQRVASQSRLFGETLGLNGTQTVHLYLAGLIHDLGQIGLPDELRNISPKLMTLPQLEQFMAHGIEGAKILATVPGLTPIADIVLHQFENFNGEGFPERIEGEQISIEARILRIVKDYDNLLLGHLLEQPLTPVQAIEYLKGHAGEFYDPKLLRQFIDFIQSLPEQEGNEAEAVVMTSQIKEGMILSKDLVLPNGGTFLTAGTDLTASAIEKLKRYEIEQDSFLTLYVK